jgi:glycerol transport system ATP-binding protein
MNFLPAAVQAEHLLMGEHRLPLGDQLHHSLAGTESLKLGIRPEHIAVLNTPAEGCLPAQVLRWQDLGTSGLLTTQCVGEVVRVRLANHSETPPVGQTVYLQVLSIHTCFYEQEALIA